MKQIKFLMILIITGLISSTCAAQPQPAKRNLLSRFSKEEVARALIPLSQWHPFPRTAKEWQDILPDTIHDKIIMLAEKYVSMPFQSLPASLMLEYVARVTAPIMKRYLFKNVSSYLRWHLRNQ